MPILTILKKAGYFFSRYQISSDSETVYREESKFFERWRGGEKSKGFFENETRKKKN